MTHLCQGTLLLICFPTLVIFQTTSFLDVVGAGMPFGSTFVTGSAHITLVFDGDAKLVLNWLHGRKTHFPATP